MNDADHDLLRRLEMATRRADQPFSPPADDEERGLREAWLRWSELLAEADQASTPPALSLPATRRVPNEPAKSNRWRLLLTLSAGVLAAVGLAVIAGLNWPWQAADDSLIVNTGQSRPLAGTEPQSPNAAASSGNASGDGSDAPDNIAAAPAVGPPELAATDRPVESWSWDDDDVDEGISRASQAFVGIHAEWYGGDGAFVSLRTRIYDLEQALDDSL